MNDNLFSDERKDYIVEYVNKNKKTTVVNLCKEFRVSPATIRNDLRELESNGLLKRMHGGAISNQKTAYELESKQKVIKNLNEKKAIAKAAVEYVDDGDTIVIDTGTTTFEFANLLMKKENLMIVTNDIKIACLFENHKTTKVLLTGGMLRKGFNCLTGPIAVKGIKDINVDKAFMATNSFSTIKGATTPSVDTAEVKSVMIKMADEVILLCTSGKIGRTSFVKFADADDFDSIITDGDIDKNKLEELRNQGLEIEIALL